MNADANTTVLVEPDQYAKAIREYVRDNPSIVKEEYREGSESGPPISIACYPMAEAYYHIKNRTPEIYCLSWSDIDPSLEGTHWYLRESQQTETQRWIDLALSENPDTREIPPYQHGTHRGFITGNDPSNRCQQILDGIDIEA